MRSRANDPTQQQLGSTERITGLTFARVVSSHRICTITIWIYLDQTSFRGKSREGAKHTCEQSLIETTLQDKQPSWHSTAQCIEQHST